MSIVAGIPGRYAMDSLAFIEIDTNEDSIQFPNFRMLPCRTTRLGSKVSPGIYPLSFAIALVARPPF